MKTNTPLRLLALVATAAALTTAVLAAPKTGDTVYSKYQRTEIYAEAKGNGFDTKVLRQVVKIRKQDHSERMEQEALLELYMAALGMQPAAAAE